MNSFLFLILLLSTSPLICQPPAQKETTEITTKISYYTYINVSQIKLQLTNDSWDVLFQLDLSSPFIKVHQSVWSHKKLNEQYITLSTNSFILRDILAITDIFPGWIYDSKGIIGLGLSNSPEENEKSLIYQLYNKRVISYKMFTLGPCKYNMKGEVVWEIGKISEEKINTKPENWYVCNMVQKRPSCHWDSMTINVGSGNDYTKTNVELKFETNEGFIYVAMDWMFYLEETYFKSMVDDDKCNWGLTNESREYTFWCMNSSEVLKNLPSLTIRIGGDYEWVLSTKDLFIYNFSGSYEFLLRAKKKGAWEGVVAYDKDENTIIFGYRAFKAFVAIFDLEREEIALFGESSVKKVNPAVAGKRRFWYPTNWDVIEEINVKKDTFAFVLFIMWMFPAAVFVAMVKYRYISRVFNIGGDRNGNEKYGWGKSWLDF